MLFSEGEMFTVSYKLSNLIKESELIKDIYDCGEDLTTALEIMEFVIAEASDLTYIVTISENQRDILLKNMDTLVAIHFRMKAKCKCHTNFFSNLGLRYFFYLKDKWEAAICEYLFTSIFDIFNQIENKRKIIDYYNAVSLSEITIMIESYLKYLGMEHYLEYTLRRLNKVESDEQFSREEDIICSLKIDKEIVVPKGLKMPRTIKYEVRREIDGLFYATTSEESARELSKYRREFVRLAYDNYTSISDAYLSIPYPHPVFFDRIRTSYDNMPISKILKRILMLVARISQFEETTELPLFVTSRHLEEIHIIARECLEVGFFKSFSKKIEDSVQLAQLIDANITSLDPPTGSKTKPAIRDD